VFKASKPALERASPIPKPVAKRPFRIVDLMVLVAATAVAFAIYRRGIPRGMSFTTFGRNREAWLFYWMHQATPFVSMWSFAVFAIDRVDSRKLRRHPRHAGIIACYAATIGLATSALISSGFYLVHALEDSGLIRKILSHQRQMHLPPPFGEAPLEEIIGGVVFGAWAALAATRRWRTEPTWVDRLGRALAVIWIALLLTYIYAYTG
jgi:hypothetical protein